MGKKKKNRKTVPGDRHVAPLLAMTNEVRKKRSSGEMQEFEVRIRVSMRLGEDGYSGSIEAKDTDKLVEAIAVVIQRSAETIDAPVDHLYAKVATVLFADRDSMEEAEE